MPKYMNSESHASNRRAFDRERVAFTAVVWPALDDPRARASSSSTAGFRVCFIDNLSMCGLSFQSSQPFAMDTVLWIRIRMGSKTCQFKGIVRRASTRMLSGRRSYVSGVQFVRSHQTTHAQAIVAGYFETCRRRMMDRRAAAPATASSLSN
jgi:hypothetical protein